MAGMPATHAPQGMTGSPVQAQLGQDAVSAYQAATEQALAGLNLGASYAMGVADFARYLVTGEISEQLAAVFE